MSRRVEWLAAASDDILDLPDLDVAASVDTTVKLFALSGVGTVLRLPNPAGADETEPVRHTELAAGPSDRYS